MLTMPSRKTGAAHIVTVPLGARSYDIAIGSGTIADLGGAVKRLSASRCAVVTDDRVAQLHLPAVRASLAASELTAGEVILPPGEARKSFPYLVSLAEALLDQGLERGDIVVALGGGVIGDLAGFAASILKRGVRLVQIPTTLLSQVDSSIGGKTGINTRHGKNLIGTFHQPSFVIIDTDVLDTLDPREFRSGYAEVVKYGLLGDRDFFEWLEKNGPAMFTGDAAARLHAVETSCRAKAEIVAEDEKELGRRALLNLGHTFGHSIEAWAGYSAKVLHGEAVAIGMMLAFEMSEEMGFCPAGEASRAAAHLRAVGLPVRIADLPAMTGGGLPTAQELIALMAQDKKAKAGRLSFVLVRRIGDSFVTDAVEPERLARFLEARCR